jgi:O-antigen/teichoic acid export membrane protein
LSSPDRSIAGRPLARRLFTNTLHAASGRLVGILLWLVFTPAILELLGPERFAIWSLFFALTGYLAALDFGLTQAALRFVAAARGRREHAEAGAFGTLAVLGYALLAMLWAVLAVGLTGPVLGWLRVPAELAGSATFAMRLGAFVFLLTGLTNVIVAVAQGYGRFDLANRILLAVATQQAVGMALVLWRGWGLEGLVLNVAAGGAFGATLGLALLRSHLPDYRWSGLGPALGKVREVVRFGAPMQITNLLAFVNANVDKVLIARFLGLARVTSYELGSRVAVSSTSLPQLLLLPILAETARMSAAGDHSRLKTLYDRGSRYFLTVSAICIAPVLAAAPRLYAVWLGQPHVEATVVLQWLACASALTLATGMGTTMARGLARTDLEAWFGCVTVVLHLLLSLVLLPRLGLTGALTASAISHAAGSLLFLTLFARLMRWRLARDVLGSFVVPTAAALAGWAAGALADQLLPGVTGLLGWLALAGVAAVAAVAAFAFTAVTGYFHWREAIDLVRVGLTPRAIGESR